MCPQVNQLYYWSDGNFAGVGIPANDTPAYGHWAYNFSLTRTAYPTLKWVPASALPATHAVLCDGQIGRGREEGGDKGALAEAPLAEMMRIPCTQLKPNMQVESNLHAALVCIRYFAALSTLKYTYYNATNSSSDRETSAFYKAGSP